MCGLLEAGLPSAFEGDEGRDPRWLFGVCERGDEKGPGDVRRSGVAAGIPLAAESGRGWLIEALRTLESEEDCRLAISDATCDLWKDTGDGLRPRDEKTDRDRGEDGRPVGKGLSALTFIVVDATEVRDDCVEPVLNIDPTALDSTWLLDAPLVTDNGDRGVTVGVVATALAIWV